MSGRGIFTHVAFRQRAEEYTEMVARQIETKGIDGPNVLQAIRMVPRHAFMPWTHYPFACIDGILPVSEGQPIRRSSVATFITETLQLNSNSRVLEIGTGLSSDYPLCRDRRRGLFDRDPCIRVGGFTGLILVTKDGEERLTQGKRSPVRFVTVKGRVFRPDEN